MTQIVGRAECIVKGHVNIVVVIVFGNHFFVSGILCRLLDCRNRIVDTVGGRKVFRNSISGKCVVFIGQHDVARRIVLGVDITAVFQHISFLHKQLPLRQRQLVPVPIADRIVQMVFCIVDDHLRITTQLRVRRCIGVGRVIGVEVRLHIHQRHLTIRGSIDGDRHLYRLTVGIACASVGRDILVVDIHLTADEPVVGRNSVCA